MYERFGPIVDHSTRKVTFKLFFPDSSKDILQYSRGGLPKIKEIYVPGTFNAGGWDEKQAPKMSVEDHPSGILYTYSTTLEKDGFYQYKFYIKFEKGTDRWVNDPCTRYGSRLGGDDNSGFVVGGNLVDSVKPITNRISPQDLIIYEMMVDDFTENLTGDKSQKNTLDLITENIKYLVDLGVTALQPLPWTTVPGTGFNWGYEPFLFFSVDERLTDRKGVLSENNVDRLYSLKLLIDALHEKNIQVIMDGVFNHARTEFPYLQLYQNKEDCPYIGLFEEGTFFEDFDFNNGCVREFIFDVCKYWIENYQIDGIRFDYVKGFFRRAGGDPGITTLISRLRRFLSETGRNNFSLILENLPDNRYQAVDDTNRINATGTWFDPLMYQAFDLGKAGQIRPSIMRALNANKDFAPGKGPVTYIENHDHGTLVNKVGGDFVGVDRNANWFKTQPYAIALFTAPGTVMIHNGQEFGDEYYIDHKDDRVRSRPLNWDRLRDNAGQTLSNLYKKLIKIREEFPGLKSPFFHPDNYNESFTRFDKDGFGVDTQRQIIIFHRWGAAKDGSNERFIIVLNCSPTKHFVDVPFPFNGDWIDLLSDETFRVTDFWRKWQDVNSHYGRIFYAKG
ncbi:alpha-amylase family glycosyl hydrolase [Microcystis aeruginosa]|uniref:1,4-alpha-glucan branching enzyme n=1 Tax=Microcystis aeruginosa 11-30S32 TaxID=2358142 RepID=A0A510PMC5_MICAE|nr:alpha-amylase family glycosyl hydrolase [Microcystis aeruginosa]GCA94997.1 1,4-alpha-glucan branching enzyme [Microcystis aeruginosa 11-30S32]